MMVHEGWDAGESATWGVTIKKSVSKRKIIPELEGCSQSNNVWVFLCLLGRGVSAAKRCSPKKKSVTLFLSSPGYNCVFC